MKLYEILIPIKSNDGKKFTVKHNQQFLDYVINLVGGHSVWPIIEGAWKDNGKVYKENMRPIRITTNSETIKQIAIKAREHYRQNCIMYYLVSNDVTFFNG